MSIAAIGSNIPYSTTEAAQKSKGDEELTTITTQCNKEHTHDQSCPHTVSTKSAPKAGENGYLLDEYV